MLRAAPAVVDAPDLVTLEPQSTFTYHGEGWGLTRDDRRLIMSDGTSVLRFLDPDTFNELDRIHPSQSGTSAGANLG